MSVIDMRWPLRFMLMENDLTEFSHPHTFDGFCFTSFAALEQGGIYTIGKFIKWRINIS